MAWLVSGVATAQHTPTVLASVCISYGHSVCAITTTHLSLMACSTMLKAVSCSLHVNTASLLNKSFDALCQCPIVFHEVTMQSSHTQHTLCTSVLSLWCMHLLNGLHHGCVWMFGICYDDTSYVVCVCCDERQEWGCDCVEERGGWHMTLVE